MNTETELIDMALAVSAASGSVADAVKKAIFHNHGIDWPLLLTLAEVLRVNAAVLGLVGRTADRAWTRRTFVQRYLRADRGATVIDQGALLALLLVAAVLGGVAVLGLVGR